MEERVHPLPDGKISVVSELKELTNDKLNVTKTLKLSFTGKKNIVKNGENASYKYFLLFPDANWGGGGGCCCSIPDMD